MSAPTPSTPAKTKAVSTTVTPASPKVTPAAAPAGDAKTDKPKRVHRPVPKMKLPVVKPELPELPVKAGKTAKPPVKKAKPDVNEAPDAGEGKSKKGGPGGEVPVKKYSVKKSKPGTLFAQLKKMSAPAVAASTGRLGEKADDYQKHETHEEKQKKAELSSDHPGELQQAKGDRKQATSIHEKPEKQPDPEKQVGSISRMLSLMTPTTIEGIQNFRAQGMIDIVGSNALLLMSSGAKQVTNDFSPLDNAAPKEPKPYEPVKLVPEPPAMPEPAMLGKNIVPVPKPAQVDVSEYSDDADAEQKKEELEDDKLDMVDSGPLYEAKGTKNELNEDVKATPGQVKGSAREEAMAASMALDQQEAQQSAAMNSTRNNTLGMTGKEQGNLKTGLEGNRKTIGTVLNEIYFSAKSKVEEDLKALEKRCTDTFEAAKEKATAEFERETDRRIEAFKAERYEGVGGWFTELWDDTLGGGIDDHETVVAIFNEERTKFQNTLAEALRTIAQDITTTVKGCRNTLNEARQKIETEIDKLPEGERKQAQEAANAIKEKLEKLDSFIDKQERSLQASMESKLDDALKAIDRRIEEKKEALKSLLERFISWIWGALKKLLKWVFGLVGIDLDPIFQFVEDMISVIKYIIFHPFEFVKRLGSALAKGFSDFWDNIGQNILQAVLGVITGDLAGDIEIPAEWNARGIFKAALSTLKILPEQLIQRLGDRVGHDNIAIARKGFDLFEEVISKGPIALWDKILEWKDELVSNFFTEAIRELVPNLLKKIGIELAKKFIPAGGFISTIIGLAKGLWFLISNIGKLIDLAKSIVGGMLAVSQGNISKAAEGVTNALKRILEVIIGFLLTFTGISGGMIMTMIKNVLNKIKTTINKLVDRALDWLADKVKPIIAKVRAGVDKLKEKGQEVVGKIVNWWTIRKPLEAKNGEKHTLYFEGEGKNARLMIRTDPMNYQNFINTIPTTGKPAKVGTLKTEALAIAKNIDEFKLKDANRGGIQDESIVTLINSLADKTSELIDAAGGTITTPPSVIKYGPLTAEGGATYADASILSPSHPLGSVPSDEPPIWTKVNKRLKSQVFIRGHLLNHNIGGPGKAFNLTPITGNGAGQGSNYANKVHLDNVEKFVKTKVNTEQKVVRYKIDAVYARHPDRSFQETLRGRIGTPAELPQDKIKLDIMNYEQENLVRGLSTSWATLKFEGGKWVDDEVQPDLSVRNVLPDGDFELKP